MVMKFLVFHSTKILIFHWFFFLHQRIGVCMQRQWLSKELAARRVKANGCQRKSQRDVLSITRRSHLTITTLQQQHLLAFP